MDFVLCLEYGFAFFGLAGLDRFVDEAFDLGDFFRRHSTNRQADRGMYLSKQGRGDAFLLQDFHGFGHFVSAANHADIGKRTF